MYFEQDLSCAQADVGVTFPLKKDQHDALYALYSEERVLVMTLALMLRNSINNFIFYNAH